MSELVSLRELIGDPGTLKLIEGFGGTRVSIPRDAAQEHALRDAIGGDAFVQLVNHFAGDRIMVPLAREWRAEIYRARGMTQREMARIFRVTEKAVYKMLNRAESKPRGERPRRIVPGQMDFFAE
jgi:hypothetical protein